MGRKKWNCAAVCLTAVILAAILLTACRAAEEEEEPGVILRLKNGCDSEIYGLHYEYYLGKEPVGGGDVQNSKGSLLPVGESCTLELTERFFPEGADLTGFSIEFFVLLEAGGEVPAGETIPLAVEMGKKYELMLSGNESDGFVCTRRG